MCRYVIRTTNSLGCRPFPTPQAWRSSRTSCHCTSSTSGAEVDIGLFVGGLGAQPELGELGGKLVHLLSGNRLAPLERPVAVLAHLAVVDAESRAGDPVHVRQRAGPEDAHELFAECPGSLGILVALQAENAPGRDLPGGDYVHDRSLSVQMFDEVSGQDAPSRVVPLDTGPVPGNPLGSGVRFQLDDHLDLGERDSDLPKRRHQAGLFQLTGLVDAIARDRVDPCRR